MKTETSTFVDPRNIKNIDRSVLKDPLQKIELFPEVSFKSFDEKEFDNFKKNLAEILWKESWV